MLAPNTYSVTVKNASGCISAATSYTINAAPSTPAAPTATANHQPLVQHQQERSPLLHQHLQQGSPIQLTEQTIPILPASLQDLLPIIIV